MAVDYRIRFYYQGSLEGLASGGLVLSARGLKRGAASDRSVPREAVTDFFDTLAQSVEEVCPVGRRLPEDQEREFARYCIVLALFEEVFRAGTRIRSPLFEPQPKQTLLALLDIAQSHWITDLCQLSWLYFDRFEHWLRRPNVLNPTFAGSRDVGGADADLIVDGCLVDIKTTVQTKLSSEWLYQLIGYTLLDYEDAYQIREVALYLARQGILLHWTVPELLLGMSENAITSLDVLRDPFKCAVQQVMERKPLPFNAGACTPSQAASAPNCCIGDAT
jgi:hypothetical protein